MIAIRFLPFCRSGSLSYALVSFGSLHNHVKEQEEGRGGGDADGKRDTAEW